MLYNTKIEFFYFIGICWDRKVVEVSTLSFLGVKNPKIALVFSQNCYLKRYKQFLGFLRGDKMPQKAYVGDKVWKKTCSCLLIY